MAQDLFDERYKLVPRKISSLKAKQPKKPPPKRTRNVGKSKCTQLNTSSSTESPSSDNRDFPSTKLSPRLERDSNNHFSIQFTINNHHFNISLAQFTKLTYLSNQGICIYSNAWGIDELEKTLEQIEPYNSRLLAIDDV
nr:hypothetical protein [Tanacetum cinerariifolium]